MSRQALRTGDRRRTCSPALACEILCCDGEQMQERTAYELRKERKFVRALPHFSEKILFIIRGVTKRVASVEPRWEDGVSDRSDELYVGTERGTRLRF